MFSIKAAFHANFLILLKGFLSVLWMVSLIEELRQLQLWSQDDNEDCKFVITPLCTSCVSMSNWGPNRWKSKNTAVFFLTQLKLVFQWDDLTSEEIIIYASSYKSKVKLSLAHMSQDSRINIADNTESLCWKLFSSWAVIILIMIITSSSLKTCSLFFKILNFLSSCIAKCGCWKWHNCRDLRSLEC